MRALDEQRSVSVLQRLKWVGAQRFAQLAAEEFLPKVVQVVQLSWEERKATVEGHIALLHLRRGQGLT